LSILLLFVKLKHKRLEEEVNGKSTRIDTTIVKEDFWNVTGGANQMDQSKERNKVDPEANGAKGKKVSSKPQNANKTVMAEETGEIRTERFKQNKPSPKHYDKTRKRGRQTTPLGEQQFETDKKGWPPNPKVPTKPQLPMR